MGSPVCYSGDGRRYSRQGLPYPGSYSDRQRLTLPSHDIRPLTMMQHESELDTTPPRKRIAVACGRCRKRKIRCSGDQGNGLPCQNCKNAGADPCLFLRVASQEAPFMRHEEFTYNIDSARAYQARGAVSALSSSSTSYATDIQDGLPRFPSSFATGYTYSGNKYYSTIPSWAPNYADDAVEYSSLTYPGYSYMNQDPAHLYRLAQGSKSASSGSLYAENDSVYSYGPSTNLVHRPATNTELPNFSLSSVAASLPQSVGSGDRLLPTPIIRAVPSSGASGYRSETASSFATSVSKSSAQSASVHLSPNNAVSEVAESYGSYEPSAASSYPPPVHHLPSGNDNPRLPNSGTGSQDPYSSTSGIGSIFSATENSLRSQSSRSELSYKYSSVSRRESNTSSSGLSNGQQYTIPLHIAGASRCHSQPSQSTIPTPAAYLISGDTTTAADVQGPPPESSGSDGRREVDIHRRPAGSQPTA